MPKEEYLHPLLQDPKTTSPIAQLDALITERAAANLSNLKYYTSLDGKLVTATTPYQDNTNKILFTSLEALGLKSPKKNSKPNSRILEEGDDFALNEMPSENKGDSKILELRLSRSGAEKLARAGVKSEVLQTFIPLEARQAGNHVSRISR